MLCGNESPGKRDLLHWRSAFALVPTVYRAGGRRSRGGGGGVLRGVGTCQLCLHGGLCVPPLQVELLLLLLVYPRGRPPPTTQNEGGLQGYLRVLAQAPGPPRPKACSRYLRRLAARSLGGLREGFGMMGSPGGGLRLCLRLEPYDATPPHRLHILALLLQMGGGLRADRCGWSRGEQN